MQVLPITATEKSKLNFNGDGFIGNDGLSIPGAYEIALQDARLKDWQSDELEQITQEI